jgi:hypothetical protein
LRCRPASSPIDRPTAVEPVNEITRTCGSVTIASPTSLPPGSICRTPAGSPASSKIRAITVPPVTAVRGSGFSSTAFPSASAGATDLIPRMIGTLNGEITATTPAGSCRAIDNRGCSLGSTWPIGCPGSEAAW